MSKMLITSTSILSWVPNTTTRLSELTEGGWTTKVTGKGIVAKVEAIATKILGHHETAGHTDGETN